MSDKVLIQVDNRGRITIPAELRKEWNISPGDYVVIDAEEKNIDKANILTDEELKDPEIVKSLLELGKKAQKEYDKDKTINLEEKD